MIAQAKPKGKAIPIISGEWGYSELYRNENEASQGKMLAREFLTNQAQGIPLSIWYDWHDDGENPKDLEHHFGTVHHAVLADSPTPYAPKPAYFAAKTLAQAFAGFRFDKRLPVGGKKDFVLLFTDGNARKIAAWTSDRDSHQVTIPLAGSFRLMSHIGEDLGEKTSTADGLHLTLTDEPVYFPVPRVSNP
jgi:hypothetical protein